MTTDSSGRTWEVLKRWRVTYVNEDQVEIVCTTSSAKNIALQPHVVNVEALDEQPT